MVENVVLRQFRCSNDTCEEPVLLTRFNAEILEFERAPGFWFLVVTCYLCSKRNWMPALLFREEAESVGCKVTIEPGEPRQDIWDDFQERTGMPRKWWKPLRGPERTEYARAVRAFREDMGHAA